MLVALNIPRSDDTGAVLAESKLVVAEGAELETVEDAEVSTREDVDAIRGVEDGAAAAGASLLVEVAGNTSGTLELGARTSVFDFATDDDPTSVDTEAVVKGSMLGVAEGATDESVVGTATSGAEDLSLAIVADCPSELALAPASKPAAEAVSLLEAPCALLLSSLHTIWLKSDLEASL